VLWEQRKYEEIVPVCRKGLKEARQIDHQPLYYRLVLSLGQLGKYDEALTEADKAVGIATDKNRVDFRLLRARLLAMAERYDKAIAECLALLKDNDEADKIHQIRYTLSGIYSSAKRHDKAEEQLRQILKDDPRDESACNDLGYIMADRNKNLEEAETLIRKAIELDREQKKLNAAKEAEEAENPDDEAKKKEKKTNISVDDDQDNASYVDSLGWVLFRRGKFEEARKELERAVKLGDAGDDPVIWDHLGDVYLRIGDKAKAKAAFDKAIKKWDGDRRRKKDDQYKELRQKVKLLQP
jgi:tetratricopeptide (TPR) repeat protein